jgi:hypothetical protein
MTEATAYWGLRLAVSRREVTPIEQIIHSFMEMMPLVGLWLAGLLREDELRALAGSARRPADFSLRLKNEPLAARYRAVPLSAIALLGVVPYFEELWRTAQAAASSSAGSQPRAAPGAIGSASNREASTGPARRSAIGLKSSAPLTGVSAVLE